MFLWKGLLAAMAVSGVALLASQAGGQDVSDKLIGSWMIMDEQGAAFSVSGDVPVISFERDQRVHGFNGCNKMMGSWSVDSDVLAIGHLATTRKACAGEAMAFEKTLSKELAAVRGFSVTREGLQLRDNAGTVLLVLKKKTL